MPLKGGNFMKKIVFNWSSGKDSALALHQLRQLPGHEIVTLFTSLYGG